MLIINIDSECISYFTRLNKLDLFCSGSTGKYKWEVIAIRLRNIVARPQRLKSVSSSFTSSVDHVSFSSTPLPPSPSIINMKLSSF